MKKLLAVSFGRKGGNCDIIAKMALVAAKKEDVEVEFINTCKLKIDRCTGCGACDKVREKGGMSLCIFKDDFIFVREKIMDADALLVVVPVYSVAPVGQFKNLVDRMGASHDRAALIAENERRRALGWSEDKMLDPRVFKNRPFACVSVGGARTPGWTSLGVPTLHLLGVSNQMIPIDAIDAYGMGDRVHPMLDEKFSDRIYRLGKNLAKALHTPEDQIKWMGDEEGYCPTCHGRTITIRDKNHVECTVCGSRGTLAVENGEIKISFTPEEIARSRYHIGGLDEHHKEIDSMMEGVHKVLAERGDEIPELMKTIEGITETVPEKK